MRPRHFLEYLLPDEIGFDEFARALSSTLQANGRFRRVRRFCDSFDWRLYKAGLTFQLEKSGRKENLTCFRRKDGLIHSAIPFEQGSAPKFAKDFSDHDLRARLASALDVRAILPQIEVICDGIAFTSSQPGLTSVCLAKTRVAPSGPDLGSWMLVALETKSRQPLDDLMEALAFPSLSPGSLLEQGLAAVNRQPQDFSPAPHLDPAMRSDMATKAILKRLLIVLETHRPGVMARIDSEFLHDFRVAIRRTRSALGQIKGVFAERSVSRYVTGFAWLGQCTGPARDLEVLLLGFDELQGQLPVSLRDGLEPLRSHLETQLDHAYGQLVINLESTRYVSLIAGWQRFLEAPAANQPRALHGLTPIGQLANQRIEKIFRRILKQGRAIDKSSPAAHLHELRKTCKKLRYLLEFFETLYPPTPFRQLIKQLKGFQDHLGQFQDIHAQIDMLRQMADDLRQQRSTPTPTFLALGALIGHLELRQALLRKTFSNAFEHFSRAENRALLQQLLATQPD